MNSPSKYTELLNILIKFFGTPAKPELSDPFRILVSTILSQRTRDEITEKVSKRLFRQVQTIEDLALIPLDDLIQILRGVNYRFQKAKRLKQIAQILLTKGSVPNTREELLQLPGVGEKTASSVLAFGLGKTDEILLDTHVFRVCSRLGLCSQSQPKSEVREAVLREYPDQDLRLVDYVFLNLGKQLCRAKKPRCRDCPIYEFCKYYRDHFGFEGPHLSENSRK
ncbi:MAG: endonuclease III domain-containing protein [Candidatus Heimdallarchaeota archaeon]